MFLYPLFGLQNETHHLASGYAAIIVMVCSYHKLYECILLFTWICLNYANTFSTATHRMMKSRLPYINSPVFWLYLTHGCFCNKIIHLPKISLLVLSLAVHDKTLILADKGKTPRHVLSVEVDFILLITGVWVIDGFLLPAYSEFFKLSIFSESNVNTQWGMDLALCIRI